MLRSKRWASRSPCLEPSEGSPKQVAALQCRVLEHWIRNLRKTLILQISRELRQRCPQDKSRVNDFRRNTITEVACMRKCDSTETTFLTQAFYLS